jgi:uridine kinase
MDRQTCVSRLGDAINSVDPGHPVRVAIDGVGASGKTMLADELEAELRRIGRPVIRSSIDRFHRPREMRYKRGANSPEGYLNDSFDYDALVSCLLLPLGPSGDLRYTTGVYDFRTESRLEPEAAVADPRAVLVFDGVFILRPELREAWDFSIFVDAGFDVTLSRALTRDVDMFGSVEAVRERYLLRYIPGESLYLDRHSPRRYADVVVLNDDPRAPLLKWKSTGGGE